MPWIETNAAIVAYTVIVTKLVLSFCLVLSSFDTQRLSLEIPKYAYVSSLGSGFDSLNETLFLRITRVN